MRADRLLLQDMAEAIAGVLETTPSAKGDFDANKFIRKEIASGKIL